MYFLSGGGHAFASLIQSGPGFGHIDSADTSLLIRRIAYQKQYLLLKFEIRLNDKRYKPKNKLMRQLICDKFNLL